MTYYVTLMLLIFIIIYSILTFDIYYNLITNKSILYNYTFYVKAIIFFVFTSMVIIHRNFLAPLIDDHIGIVSSQFIMIVVNVTLYIIKTKQK